MWDGFERTGSVTAYPMAADHDTERRTRLVTEPDAYLAPLAKPRPGRRLKPLDRLWSKSGRVFVAERLRLNTARIVATRSETIALSNVWWPIRLADVRFERALTVWLNSSLGLLTILTRRTSTEGGWVALKKADLEDLPVPDVRAFSTGSGAGSVGPPRPTGTGRFRAAARDVVVSSADGVGRGTLRSARPTESWNASRVVGVGACRLEQASVGRRGCHASAQRRTRAFVRPRRTFRASIVPGGPPSAEGGSSGARGSLGRSPG